MDSAVALLAVVNILRVEHLIASVIWILRRGEGWAADIRQFIPAIQDDPVRMWLLYRRHGGGTLPYLFFGIKSYRLHAACSDPRRSAFAKGMLGCTRFAWRGYVFVPITILILVLCCLASTTWSDLARCSLMVAASSAVLAMIAIAAEGTLSSHIFDGSWAVEYHRWNRHGNSTRKAPLKEISFFVGSFLIGLCAAVALILTAATQFDAYENFPTEGSAVARLSHALALAVPGMLSASWVSATSVAGIVSNVLVLLLYGAYVLIFYGMGGPRLWRA